ncbi:tetratricopeptide repeat protein [Dyadobacter sp. LHD-138]|uniref:tetratricopeptide repeat protein n=1 Tax=Dyadobacter sp. LHD-138 TaxID=3071413 RepID=UPI0027DEE633|nr:tetratricopeptide repeat protein [Dyadobacter sp. LHD-138]MDQ6482168.1 tetratricopeptide repeat protein [Dyadobacter sp. LHD-138]
MEGIIKKIIDTIRIIIPKIIVLKKHITTAFIERFIATSCAILGVIFGYIGIQNNKNTSSNAENNFKKENIIYTNKKDSLYIIVARFEDYISSIESECFGMYLSNRINNLADEGNLPIKSTYIKTTIESKSDAKKISFNSNSDIILWGNIHNIKSNCSIGDICFKSTASDTLLSIISSEYNTENNNTKLEKSISTEDIQQGNFHINDKRFDKWLITIYNAKIGKTNPSLIAWNENSSNEEKSIIVTEQGHAFSLLEMNESAISSYDLAISINPYNNIALMLRGHIFAKMKEYKKAIVDFNNSIIINPDLKENYHYLAVSHYNVSSTYEAIKACNEGLKFDSTNAELYSLKAKCYWKQDSLFQSLRYFDIAINYDSTVADFYSSRANLKSVLKRHEAAILDYKIASRLDPYESTYYLEIGAIKANCGEYEEAIHNFEKSILLNPDDSISHKNIVLSLIHLGQHKKSNELLNKSIRKFKMYNDLFIIGANLEFSLNNIDKSKQYINIVLSRKPKDHDALFLMATIKIYENNNKSAIDDLLLIKKQNYKYKNINLKLSEANSGLGNYNESIKLITEDLIEDSANVELWKYRSEYFIKNNNLSSAKSDLSFVSKLMSNDTLFNYYSAYIFYTNKKYREASDYYQKLIEISPTDTAYYWAGRTYQHLKDHNSAIKYFGKAIELNPKFSWAYHSRSKSNFYKKNILLGILDHIIYIILDRFFRIVSISTILYFINKFKPWKLLYSKNSTI